MLVVASVLVAILLPRQLASIDAAQVDKAVAYARQSSTQLEPAIAFDDHSTAKEIVDGLARDTEVVAATVAHADGRVVHTFGTAFEAPKDHPDKVRVVRGASSVTVVVPIVSREGARGWLQFQLSRERQLAARSETMKLAAGALAISLLLGLVGAFLVARPLVSRIGALTRVAEEVAAGDLERNLPANAQRDEVGRLHDAFARMLQQLRTLIAEREEQSRTELERLDSLVRERTQKLEQRQRENQLVLDNVSQGLLIVHPDGSLGSEHSRAVVQWFGELTAGQPFWQYLAPSDEAVAGNYQLGWEQIADGLLPLEVCLEQFPRTLHLGDKVLRTTLVAIENDELGRMLLVVEDASDEYARSAAEMASRELASALHHLSNDREGFLEFVNEAGRLIDGINAASCVDAKLKRDLHTLKGSAGMFGLERVVSVCHELESYLAESGEMLGFTHKEQLTAAWSTIHKVLSVMGRSSEQKLELDRRELRRLAFAIDAGESRERLQRRVRMFEREPASRRLGRIAEQARALAVRTGAGDVDIVVEDGGLKLDNDALKPFWTSFPHVVRNAFSHAFEPAEERLAAGKPPAPSLRLRTKLSAEALVVEAVDDGRGIDWERLREVATQRGMSTSSKKELVNALFADGVSTRESADAMSGRGEGMGAVKAAVESLGGSITLESEPGRGTAFRFSFAPDYADLQDRITTRPPPRDHYAH